MWQPRPPQIEPFTFATSRQVDFPVYVKINELEGKQTPVQLSRLLQDPVLRHLGSHQNPNSDLYVTVQLWSDSKPLGVSMQTSYRYFNNSRSWNEWLKLPVSIKELSLSSQLAITVWDLSACETGGSSGHAVPFGGTTIALFDKDGILLKGRQKCKLHRRRAADGLASTSTPWIPHLGRVRRRDHSTLDQLPEEKELERLERLFKQLEMAEIPRIDWLDRLAFRALTRTKQAADEAAGKRAAQIRAEKRARKNRTERNLDASGQQHGSSTVESDSDSEQSDYDDEIFTLYIEFPRYDFPIVFTDFEYPSPKYIPQIQMGSSSSNVPLKPPPEVQYGPGISGVTDADDNDDDVGIIRIYDPEQFQRDNPCETKHRRLVRSERNGILDRDQKPNAKLRDELNDIMTYGPTQDLNPEEKDLIWRFRHHLSRDKRALVKLVKATNWQDPTEARQAVELIPKWAEIDVDDALELLGPTFDNSVVRAYAVDRLRKANDEELLLYLVQLVQALKFEKISTDTEQNESLEDSSLGKFLIERASNNFGLANFLHWYLMVECDDRSPENNASELRLFARVSFYLMASLNRYHPTQRNDLKRQGELVTVLSKISKDLRFSRMSRPQKVDALKKYLADEKNELVNISPPLPLPLNPLISIIGVVPEEANVFKSSLSPLFLTFRTSLNETYSIIFKTGDDLRQDQLVIQIISLMDVLLRKENLDLKLTPYRILATSPLAGAVQFIRSTSLSAASAKYKGSILAYLQTNNPDPKGPLGVRKDAMDTYLKSCAGYCVITYILGVGDRHLENLLLAPDGHFFHVDFGFILGRDPKPFAPMMKLCKEMVEGMGGVQSSQYRQFKQYCFTAYTTLRKSSSLILNLFNLMVDANVPDIRMEPDKAVLKVRDRFHLDMSEEDAVRALDQVISDSVNAVFGVVIDRIHDFVQGWRA